MLSQELKGGVYIYISYSTGVSVVREIYHRGGVKKFSRRYSRVLYEDLRPHPSALLSKLSPCFKWL